MNRTVPLTVVLLSCVFLTLACVADASLATTPVVPPTQAPPSVAQTPNLTPVLPAKPPAPAAGTYFGQVIAVDPLGGTVTFTSACLGADRKVMREMAPNDKAPRVIPLLSTTEVIIFSSPPNNPAAGRMVTIDPLQLVEVVRVNPAAKFFLTVEPQGVKSLEQDSGVRPSAALDDPCPHF